MRGSSPWLGDLAVGIVQVAEDDRLRRARRLAGGHDFAVADRPVLLLGLDARGVDALHAVRALLHHAAAADRDVGIAQQLQRLGVSKSAYWKKLKWRTLYGQLFEQ